MDIKDNSGSRKVRGFLTRIGLPAILITGLLLVYTQFFTGDEPDAITELIDVISPVKDSEAKDEETEEEIFEKLDNYLPTSSENQVVSHDHFTLSYIESYEQAEWVAYELAAEQLEGEKVNRSTSFREDPKVNSGSASPRDYIRSGYDRGHLAPAADMAFSAEAMRQSFYMSNVSPQVPAFNRGIWRELEEQTRDWSRANKHLYVVTGPILAQRAIKRFGPKKGVAAPRSYYKILLDLREPEQKAVAFLLPNAKSNHRLNEYIVTIDSVEQLTGIDFFPELPDELESELESYFDPLRWIYDEERYQLRVGLWNKQGELAKSYE
ncbi:MAG: DNA/RNA non-specific endonuclease [Bacteroidota bacterium]